MQLFSHFKKWSRIDSAENSIMQTITIAVSAITIAAGITSMPNIVNAQRDNKVRVDLGEVAAGEDYYNTGTGTYTTVLSSISGKTGTGGTKINLTPNTWTLIKQTSTTGYGVLGVSQNGNVYVINGSNKTPLWVGTVTFNGNISATKTIKSGSFKLRTTGPSAPQIAQMMSDSGFTTTDAQTAVRNK